jgi:FixJ family two-component response regulator
MHGAVLLDIGDLPSKYVVDMSTEKERLVCVVDDDEFVRESMRALLESFGFTVKTFALASDFLRDQDPAAVGCLLLDLQMPGMSGVELLEELRSRNILVPAIVISANGTKYAARAVRANALAVLRKPVAEEELLRWIESAFADSRSR